MEHRQAPHLGSELLHLISWQACVLGCLKLRGSYAHGVSKCRLLGVLWWAPRASGQAGVSRKLRGSCHLRRRGWCCSDLLLGDHLLLRLLGDLHSSTWLLVLERYPHGRGTQQRDPLAVALLLPRHEAIHPPLAIRAGL